MSKKIQFMATYGSPEHVTKLLNDTDTHERHFLHNPTLSPENLTHIIRRTENTDVVHRVIGHPSFNSSHVDQLTDESSPADHYGIMDAFTSNKATPEQQIKGLSFDGGAYQRYIVSLTNHPEVIHAAFKHDLNHRAKRMMLTSPHLTREMHSAYLKDKNADVRLAAVNHKFTTHPQALEAMNDPDVDVKMAARKVAAHHEIKHELNKAKMTTLPNQ